MAAEQKTTKQIFMPITSPAATLYGDADDKKQNQPTVSDYLLGQPNITGRKKYLFGLTSIWFGIGKILSTTPLIGSLFSILTAPYQNGIQAMTASLDFNSSKGDVLRPAAKLFLNVLVTLFIIAILAGLTPFLGGFALAGFATMTVAQQVLSIIMATHVFMSIARMLFLIPAYSEKQRWEDIKSQVASKLEAAQVQDQSDTPVESKLNAIDIQDPTNMRKAELLKTLFKYEQYVSAKNNAPNSQLSQKEIKRAFPNLLKIAIHFKTHNINDQNCQLKLELLTMLLDYERYLLREQLPPLTAEQTSTVIAKTTPVAVHLKAKGIQGQLYNFLTTLTDFECAINNTLVTINDFQLTIDEIGELLPQINNRQDLLEDDFFDICGSTERIRIPYIASLLEYELEKNTKASKKFNFSNLEPSPFEEILRNVERETNFKFLPEHIYKINLINLLPLKGGKQTNIQALEQALLIYALSHSENTQKLESKSKLRPQALKHMKALLKKARSNVYKLKRNPEGYTSEKNVKRMLKLENIDLILGADLIRKLGDIEEFKHTVKTKNFKEYPDGHKPATIIDPELFLKYNQAIESYQERLEAYDLDNQKTPTKKESKEQPTKSILDKGKSAFNMFNRSEHVKSDLKAIKPLSQEEIPRLKAAFTQAAIPKRLFTSNGKLRTDSQRICVMSKQRIKDIIAIEDIELIIGAQAKQNLEVLAKPGRFAKVKVGSKLRNLIKQKTKEALESLGLQNISNFIPSKTTQSESTISYSSLTNNSSTMFSNASTINYSRSDSPSATGLSEENDDQPSMVRTDEYPSLSIRNSSELP